MRALRLLWQATGRMLLIAALLPREDSRTFSRGFCHRRVRRRDQRPEKP
jgi:hypothetical protein